MNMSYCRFENTYNDLIDCKNALDRNNIQSETEARYAKKLIELCREISENYDEEDINEEEY